MKKSVFKALTFSLLLLCVPVFLFAQREGLSQHLSPLKKQLEGGAEILFSSHTYTSTGELLQRDQGQLITYKEKFRLTYTVFTATYNGTLFSYYNKEEKTFTLMHPTVEDLATINPLAYLSTSQKMYTVRELPENKKGRAFSFTPKKNTMNIHHIELTISPKTGLPLELMTLFSDGTRVVMYIDSLVIQKNISNRLFSQKHSDYPGSELVDLR